MKNIFLSVLFLFTLYNKSFSQTILPAIISQNTVLLKQNSPYIINTSTLVSENVILSINPGVEITINGALNVRGIIFALGAENDSIRFHCNNSNAPSIRVIKGINDTLNVFSIFNFCVINSNNIGIYSFNRKIEVNNSKVSNCFLDGLYIENGALRVNECVIENNLGSGIFTRSIDNISSQIAVDSCYISNSSVSFNKRLGIDWGLNGFADFSHSLTYNVSFSANVIKGNSKEGIKLLGSAHRTYIYDNLFLENDSFGISLGINGGWNLATTFVKGNIISKNKGALGSNIPHSAKVWNNIFLNNYVNESNTNGLASNKPEVFDIKNSSLFFHNNIVSHNQFVDLISFTTSNSYSDSLNINSNLFYLNIPKTTSQSSFLFLDPENGSNSVQWDWFKFKHNNIFHDQSSSYWIKNQYKVLDFIADSNFKNTEKPNFDGLNGFYGFVYEINQLNSPDINAPISPVRYSLIDSTGIKYLVWKQNPEKDLKGYKIYFGKISDFEYANTIDVGMKNIYRIPNEYSFVTDFTVTAYDKEADGIKDFFEGHESWYSTPQIGPGIIIKKGTEILQSPVSSCPNQTYHLKSVGSCSSVIWSNGSTSKDLIINNLNTNSSYYFDCINPTPITHSIRSETVNFYVNPNQLNHSVVMPDESVQIFNALKIGSSSSFGSNSDVKLEAGNQVILEPGFFFSGNKKFVAEIKNCHN
jgi:hypothetical protein